MKTHESTKDVTSWEARRWIKIPALIHDADGAVIERALGEIAGVHRIGINLSKKRLIVEYDASKLSYQAIADVLEKTGFPPSNNWWSRIKAGWYEYADSNSRENAKVPPSACCNKTPK